MKKNIKKLLFSFLFVLGLLLINTELVYAQTVNVCTYSGKCSFDISLGPNGEYTSCNLSISYDTETSTFSTDGNIHSRYVLQGNDELINSFTCPTYAYYDDAFNTEICFDNDGTACIDKYDDLMSTHFADRGAFPLNFSLKNKINSVQVSSNCDELSSENYLSNLLINNDFGRISNTSLIKPIYDKVNSALDECIDHIDKNLSDEEQQKLEYKYKNTISSNKNDYKNVSEDYGGTDVTSTCEGLLGSEMVEFLQRIFNYIKIIGPVMALLLGMLDFIKATASGEDDAKKKAIKNVKNRLIAAFALFFVPVIINMLLNFVGGFGGTCGIN